jgi:3D (Asp-Asp-Asp) domain-containing protein
MCGGLLIYMTMKQNIKKQWSIALLLLTALPQIQFPALFTQPVIAAPLQHEEIASTSITDHMADDHQRTKITIDVTGFSSTPDQTDETPFIMATGKHVHDGAVATNFLPFGTRVKIPSLFGDKIFTVEDRMNSRYYHRMDVWFSSRGEALKFGKRTVEIEIL